MKCTYLKNCRGFTVAELTVGLFLMLIVLATVNIFFMFGLNTYYRCLDRLEVQENLSVGMDRLSRELRQAAYIGSFSDSLGGKLTFKNPQGDVITYQINTSSDSEHAKELIRVIRGHGYNPVARYVRSLRVEPADAGKNSKTVNLILTGEKGRSGVIDISTTVTLRK